MSEDPCDQDDGVADKMFTDGVGWQTQIVGGNLVTNPTRTKGLQMKVNTDTTEIGAEASG